MMQGNKISSGSDSPFLNFSLKFFKGFQDTVRKSPINVTKASFPQYKITFAYYMLINDFTLRILGHFHHLLSITQCSERNLCIFHFKEPTSPSGPESPQRKTCWKVKKPEKKNQKSNFDITDHWNPLDVRCLRGWVEGGEGGTAIQYSTLKQAGVNVEPSKARVPLKPGGQRSPSACCPWPHL